MVFTVVCVFKVVWFISKSERTFNVLITPQFHLCFDYFLRLVVGLSFCRHQMLKRRNNLIIFEITNVMHDLNNSRHVWQLYIAASHSF